MTLKVVLKERESGGFSAFVPSLPGCIGSGKNEDEALMNIQSEILRFYGIEEVFSTDLPDIPVSPN